MHFTKKYKMFNLTAPNFATGYIFNEQLMGLLGKKEFLQETKTKQVLYILQYHFVHQHKMNEKIIKIETTFQQNKVKTEIDNI